MAELPINQIHNVFKKYRQMQFVNPYRFNTAPTVLPFVSTWKTDNLSTDSSADNQVKLPLVHTGVYNFTVDWGDGNSDIITIWNQAEVTHTYGSIGTYTISITGTIKGFRFNNVGDKLKILSITNFGILRLTDDLGTFYGTSNLNLSAVSDILDLGTNKTVLSSMFRASGVTYINRLNEWNTTLCTVTYLMFANSLINQSMSFDTQNVTSWDNMFASANQQDSALNFNTSSGLTFYDCFQSNTKFNQPLNWDMSSATNLFGMFRFGKFAQNVGNWNISNVTNLSAFMQGRTPTTLPSAVLDAIYIGWASRPVKPDLTPNFGTSKYTSAASAARAILTGAPNNWIITDGGEI